MATETKYCVVTADPNTSKPVVRSAGGTQTEAKTLAGKYLKRGLCAWTKEYEKEITYGWSNTISIGVNAVATGYSSIAIGSHSYATVPNQTTIGNGIGDTIIGSAGGGKVEVGGIDIKEKFAEIEAQLKKIQETKDKSLVLQGLTYGLGAIILAIVLIPYVI